MLIVYIIIFLCIIFQAERGIFDTLAFLKLFKKLNASENISTIDNTTEINKDVYILIPVLNEQTIIEDTLLYFCKQFAPTHSFKIIVITTIRETKENTQDHITTEHIVRESITNGKLSKYRNFVSIVKTQDALGNMATQLNEAITSLLDTVPDDSVFMLYNADSKPSPRTLRIFNKLRSLHKGSDFAIQQPCAYIKDMSVCAPIFQNAIALYQSWYCLGHEFRLIDKYESKYLESKPKILQNYLGVLVGHGSGMSFNTNRSNGGYPSHLLTEDLTFGYILSSKKVPIYLLPALELADVPRTLSTFIKQKSVWFWNYIGYISCFKQMGMKENSSKILFELLLRGLGGGAYWYFSAFFILTPLFLSVALKLYWIALVSIISTVLFYLLPQYILFKKLPIILTNQGFEDNASKIQKISFLKLTIPLLIVFIADSIGPWIAVVKSMKFYITGNLPTKYKTED